MIFCTSLICLVSVLLMVAPLRQIAASFAREEKLAAGKPLGWRRWLKFAAMVRNENHPQHRPAAQVITLLPAVFLTAAMTALLLAHSR